MNRSEVFSKIALYLAEAKQRNSSLIQVLDWLSKDLGLRRGIITLADQNLDRVQATIVGSEVPTSVVRKMNYKPGEGITGTVFSTGESVFINDLRQSEYIDRSEIRKGIDLENLAFFCVPINYDNETVGTLSVDVEKQQSERSDSLLQFLVNVTKLIAPFVQYSRLRESFDLFVSAKNPGGAFDNLIGNSTPMKEIKKLVAKVANSPTTIMISGDTGTGKGELAAAIHNLSSRKNNPFVEVNCGAIPENLIESELFGHERGAFTGAITHRVGVFERAGTGTVFLDEIGELPLALQTRLLTVLQNRKFERVGGHKTIAMNARIITATNKDLEVEAREGRFRQDLYFRISVFPVMMPSLKKRGKADIMQLTDYFAQKFGKRAKTVIHRFDTPAIDMITAYHWPGNVRELENVIERAVLLSENGVIHGHHLPPSLQMNRYGGNSNFSGSFEEQVAALEIDLITEALKDCRGNQTNAGKQLGLTKRIIQYKINKYEIDYKKFR